MIKEMVGDHLGEVVVFLLVGEVVGEVVVFLLVVFLLVVSYQLVHSHHQHSNHDIYDIYDHHF
jgi:hypothetical protein